MMKALKKRILVAVMSVSLLATSLASMQICAEEAPTEQVNVEITQVKEITNTPGESDTAPSESIPDSSESAPDLSESAPDPSESAPDLSESAPDPSESAPAPNESIPDSSESIPESGESTPESNVSAPAVTTFAAVPSTTSSTNVGIGGDMIEGGNNTDTDKYPAQSDTVETNYEITLDEDGYFHINYKIASDAEGDQVIDLTKTIDLLNDYAKSLNVADYPILPGDSNKFVVTMTNESGHTYVYKEGSFILSTAQQPEGTDSGVTGFDGQEIDYSYIGALAKSKPIQELLGVTSSSKITVDNIVTLYDKLAEKNYTGENALTDYLLDYYNNDKTYARQDGTKYTSIDELLKEKPSAIVNMQGGMANHQYTVSADKLNELKENHNDFFEKGAIVKENADGTYMLQFKWPETDLAAASYDLFYNELLSFAFGDDFVKLFEEEDYFKNSWAGTDTAVGDYMNNTTSSYAGIDAGFWDRVMGAYNKTTATKEFEKQVADKVEQIVKANIDNQVKAAVEKEIKASQEYLDLVESYKKDKKYSTYKAQTEALKDLKALKGAELSAQLYNSVYDTYYASQSKTQLLAAQKTLYKEALTTELEQVMPTGIQDAANAYFTKLTAQGLTSDEASQIAFKMAMSIDGPLTNNAYQLYYLSWYNSLTLKQKDGDLHLEKVDEAGNVITSDETEFRLWYVKTEVTDESGATQDVNYYCTWDEAKGCYVFVTDESTITTTNGVLDIKYLLPDIIYYLQETGAPDGYQLDSTIYVINGEGVGEYVKLGDIVSGGTLNVSVTNVEIVESTTPPTDPTTPDPTPVTPVATPGTAVLGISAAPETAVLGQMAAPEVAVLGESKGPGTGDTTPIAVWLVLIACASVTLIVTVKKNKKTSDK